MPGNGVTVQQPPHVDKKQKSGGTTKFSVTLEIALKKTVDCAKEYVFMFTPAVMQPEEVLQDWYVCSKSRFLPLPHSHLICH